MGQGFNIVDDLATEGSIGGSSQFSFFVSDSDDSELTFGGYRPERLASDIVWAPVKVESWWQVAIDDIAFNNQPKNLCDGACQVAVDTGTSMLALDVPPPKGPVFIFGAPFLRRFVTIYDRS